jgi:hypothetical protein
VRNVAVVDLKPQTDIPHTGTRMPFTVLVKNTGTEPVTGLTVTLKVDGQPLDKDAQPIEKLGPGETRPVTLTGKIDQAGWRVLTAEVKPDQLDDDNKFDKVILVREKVRVWKELKKSVGGSAPAPAPSPKTPTPEEEKKAAELHQKALDLLQKPDKTEAVKVLEDLLASYGHTKYVQEKARGLQAAIAAFKKKDAPK